MSGRSDEPFTPVDGIARWTKGLLALTLALAVVGIVSGFLQIQLLARAMTEGVTEAEAEANDSRQSLIGILQTVAYIGAGIAFLVWFHRAHRNLRSLGERGLKYTPGWAVGGFFFPFLNLVRPLQVMREVWHGSDPSRPRNAGSSDSVQRNHLGTPALIGWWWALFLISGFLSRILMQMSKKSDPSLDELQNLSNMLVVSDVVDLPGILVAILLVGRITVWQSQRGVEIGPVSGGTAGGVVA